MKAPSDTIKNIAAKWAAAKNPYEAMTNDLNALWDKSKTFKPQDIVDRFAAAKWLLLSSDKIIVGKPKNPPTTGDRYWSAIIQEYFFEKTAFGGMNSKEIAELTKGESLWDMDQKSDEAWEIQS